MFCIFLNSLTLAIYDYGDRENHSGRNKFVEKTGWIFTFIFTSEAFVKIISMGFIAHKNSYLRDRWNWIDFLVVVIGLVEVVPGIPNLKALRTLRVMRPLKSITYIPSMKRQINSLLQAIPALGNVIIFFIFIFLLFGILGA
jgi:hypothetical protein